jgi:electron transport complex protein RnfB
MGEIVWPVLAVGGMGLCFGLILALAAKAFHVEVDERIESIWEILPHAECGACGYVGCAPYSKAIIEGGEAINKCAPGGSAVVGWIADILGVEASADEPKIARLKCQGCEAHCPADANYYGAETCTAAALASGGFKKCPHSCLGMGDCADACPFDCLYMATDGLPKVIEENCTGCANCVEACPKNLFELVPISRRTIIRCENKQNAIESGKVCQTACIACSKCVKACEYDAIDFIDNLSVIRYEDCTDCGACAPVCPTNVIYDGAADLRSLAQAS